MLTSKSIYNAKATSVPAMHMNCFAFDTAEKNSALNLSAIHSLPAAQFKNVSAIIKIQLIGKQASE